MRKIYISNAVGLVFIACEVREVIDCLLWPKMLEFLHFGTVMGLVMYLHTQAFLCLDFNILYLLYKQTNSNNCSNDYRL